MNKTNLLSQAGSFWQWLLASSADPTKAALTVQGFFSIAAVQTIFTLLGYVGIHPTFTLALVGQDAYTIVYSVLMAISFLATAYGLLRKWIINFHNLVPAKPPTA